MSETKLSPSTRVALQVGNIIGYILTVVVNTLATTLPLNGKETGDLSDAIPNLFVPAGITFSIWGVIYVLLGGFALYQGRDLFKKDKVEMGFQEKISFWFIIASAANIAWIFLWHWVLVPLSLVAMLVLFASLLIIYLRLGIGVTEVERNEKYLVHTPISVYIGWITVATIANVTAVLVTADLPSYGLSEPVWTILVIIVGLLITVLMLLTRKDIAYSLVIVWAYLGIVIKRLDPELEPQVAIVVTTIISIVVVLAFIAWTAIKNRKRA